VIQEHIKKPLADEVLFGKLKNGGHVRVVVTREEGEEGEGRDKTGQEKLGFEFVDGPVVPKPEKIPPVRPKSKRRGGGGGGGPKRMRPSGPRGEGGAGPANRGSVPKIPLVRV
jgi:ATP-dependent Clp protease ATP-binding subunit ClpA